ncbi:MAG: sulfite exporter TauE/SafE family protein [Gemmatimonadaceae bacterium]|nr:sulfite exporter TauE/SafE family protein [Gemmatimonadaceae bacterium]
MSADQLALAGAAAFLGGAINAIAGGGTLLTFPALVAAGLPPLVANATSTVALVPGALGSMAGYRSELAGARRWAIAITLPSLMGGALGAWLLLHTPNSTFNRVVPWLVLAATALFILQPRLVRWTTTHDTAPVNDIALTKAGPSVPLLVWQFTIGIYGGYFGAGVGILMLAALGFMGFTNIHRMNGLKAWGGFCMNAVAALAFSLSGIVRWPVALGMAIITTAGGYIGSRGAQRVPRHYVRAVVAIVGLSSAVWLLARA